jgi:hypothetical protein
MSSPSVTSEKYDWPGHGLRETIKREELRQKYHNCSEGAGINAPCRVRDDADDPLRPASSRQRGAWRDQPCLY